jgi:hypothetical protein
MEDKLEISTTATSSQSQTQEAFVLYANHFLGSLPDHTIIFFLNGHGSCWTIDGLCKLIEKGIFLSLFHHTLPSGCSPMTARSTEDCTNAWKCQHNNSKECHSSLEHLSSNLSMLNKCKDLSEWHWRPKRELDG